MARSLAWIASPVSGWKMPYLHRGRRPREILLHVHPGDYVMTEAPRSPDTGLLPCPFCGSTDVDPEGWMSINKDGTQKKTGPACDECGGSTESIERWNTRPCRTAQGLDPATIEACAKVCEDLRHEDYSCETSEWSGGTFDCARAIRALKPGTAQTPSRVPTEAMLTAARDWSDKKYGKPIGNDAAIGCWQAMWDASPASSTVRSHLSLSEEFVAGKPDWRIVRVIPEQRIVLSSFGNDREKAESEYRSRVSQTERGE